MLSGPGTRRAALPTWWLHRHKATGRRYSGRPVGIVGSANNNRAHHSAVAKHKIRLIRIKISFMPVSLGRRFGCFAMLQGLLYAINHGAQVVNISAGMSFTDAMANMSVEQQIEIAVAKHKIRLIRIKILRNTHIVGTCLYIIRRHYVGIRKFRIIQIKIAVDHGNSDMERWAERFKELYPEDGYEVLFSDPNTKLMAIQVPSERRVDLFPAAGSHRIPKAPKRNNDGLQSLFYRNGFSS